MTEVRIGGVREHFNTPWHLAMEEGKFKEKNLELRWRDCHGGTGEMTKALRENELDVAVLLTEGITTDIILGNPSRIVQTYVKSPLRWGVHVPTDSDVQSIEDLEGKPFAISRLQSGSHLMTYVAAQERGWNLDALEFIIVGNVDGAMDALKEHVAYGFLWEKFTTQPFVDAGKCRRVGEVPTPWPCFSIAVRKDFLDSNREQIDALLDVINQRCRELYADPDAARIIGERHGLATEEVAEWLKELEWTGERYLDRDDLQKVMNTLVELGIVENEIPMSELIA